MRTTSLIRWKNFLAIEKVNCKKISCLIKTIVMSDKKIPWAKPDIGKDELFEIIDSFKTDWLTMGPKTKKLEDSMAKFLNVPYAIAVSNGTIALDLALKALGVKYGDEVIVPAMTYFATVSAVCYQGAIPPIMTKSLKSDGNII